MNNLKCRSGLLSFGDNYHHSNGDNQNLWMESRIITAVSLILSLLLFSFSQDSFALNSDSRENDISAAAYNSKGAEYSYQGQHKNAIRYYNKAIEINSKYAQAYYNRGVSNQDLGLNEQAMNDYQKAIEIHEQ